MKPVILALVGATALAVPANAAQLAALSGDRLVYIDTNSRAVIGAVRIRGVDSPVLGIDVRPANGMLYALTRSGGVYTVDLRSGRATMRSRLQTMPPRGVAVTVDFNPVADRLRVIGADGTNLRANVDDGMVTTDGRLRFAPGAGNGMPRIIAGAYSNSVRGATMTTLYDIGANGAFFRQMPPNDGILVPTGSLGVRPMAFDIGPNGTGGQVGWAITGAHLLQVDISTGAARRVGMIRGLSGPVRDVAVIPSRMM